jgi:hypothetical protein
MLHLLDGLRRPTDADRSNFSNRRLRKGIEDGMSPLRLLVAAFVNTFGITPPAREGEVMAGRVIAVMLACVLVLLVAAAWVLRSAFLR